jgi:hypothetical protein
MTLLRLILSCALISAISVLPAAAANPLTLPIEVVGENGTTGTVTIDVPVGRSSGIRSLWMQIHNLSYADMISVQVNQSAWFSLANETVRVAEPGKSYGGIGGGITTLKVTLDLPAGTAVDGSNTIRFRFNHTDGLASGFRVIAFNFLAGDSTRILDPSTFAQEDPDKWTPPLTDTASIRAGREHWNKALLRANALPNSGGIRAHCADCHASDGRDLKYFGFSNASIVARSRFHGLSTLQGEQIASYIRSLPVPTSGRPWNPPYQPGPGIDDQPISKWAAGAGLSWVLDNDSATLPYLFGTATDLKSAFQPDGNLNPRQIPIALPLPDWNHWLPRVHPLDAWGTSFQKSELLRLYEQTLRPLLASSDLSNTVSAGRIVSSFEKWRVARRTLLKPFIERNGITWTPDLASKAYATQLWQLVKTWDMTQEYGLEGHGRELLGTDSEPRTWFNGIPAATAPAAVNIPSGPSGMGGSALTNEYFNAAWYQVQVLVNSGNHRHRDRFPLDWIHAVGGFYDLYRESNRPEPARLLVTIIKALQSTDKRIGPDDIVQGWRPNQNVDPRIMVNEAWSPLFEPLSNDMRRAITESWLAAWLDKNLQYPVGRYFRVGLTEASYSATGYEADYAGFSGGQVWEAAPLFLAAGVNSDLVKQLQKWGASYIDMANRFSYAPGRTSRPVPRP